MRLFKTLSFAMLALGAMPALANELDPVLNAPGALIVREDAQGTREVFQADSNEAVKDDEAAEAAVAAFVREDNRVSKVAAGGELDQVTSDESWHYWYSSRYSYYGSYYYSWSYRPLYSSYSYSYHYYPSYRWSWGGYSYSYYPRNSHCYRW